MQTWTHIHAPKHFKEKTLAQLFLFKISSCIYHRLQTGFYLHSTGYINTHTHTTPLNSYYLCDTIGDFFAIIKSRLIESGFLRLHRHNNKKKGPCVAASLTSVSVCRISTHLLINSLISFLPGVPRRDHSFQWCRGIYSHLQPHHSNAGGLHAQHYVHTVWHAQREAPRLQGLCGFSLCLMCCVYTVSAAS